MVDPTDVTKFDRNKAELEEFLLFCVAVAGKTASQISVALERFLANGPEAVSPFDKVRYLIKKKKLREAIIESKLGQHNKLTRAFTELVKADYDLPKITTDELETIHGVGPKTSRFFILHTQPKVRIACLDTHVLKYLGELGHDVPKTTPTGKRYRELEKAFIEHCDEVGKDIATLDLEVWNRYSRKAS